ncbi:MAG: TraB/GumN family protein [Pseudomonadota bacterium]|nr:TraB/GumN family protein [Pseudomonadota bacterium]
MPAFSKARLLVAIGALSLAACSSEPAYIQPEPSPLVYEISGPQGAVEGWMLGTMHALPDGVRWRTDGIERAVSSADYLIVEIADLQGSKARQIYEELAITPGQPPLEERVPPSLRSALLEMVDDIGASPEQFANVETWASALSIGQAISTGDRANGVDRAVIADFEGKRIEEFEGAFAQLTIFDELAEEDQRTLLAGVVEEKLEADEDADALLNAWLTGDETALEGYTNDGIMGDAELRTALLTDRNNAWMQRLLADLKSDAKPLVAVGAAHLVGPEGLAAQLSASGYTVTRLR